MEGLKGAAGFPVRDSGLNGNPTPGIQNPEPPRAAAGSFLLHTLGDRAQQLRPGSPAGHRQSRSNCATQSKGTANSHEDAKDAKNCEALCFPFGFFQTSRDAGFCVAGPAHE